MRVIQFVVVVVSVRVMVVFLVTGEHLNAFARIDHGQIRPERNHLIHELLHPAAVDDQRIRALQRHHVAGLKLIVVQTADILFRHVLHRHAVNAVRHVQRQHIHRIKTRHNRGLSVLLGGAARGKQGEKRPESAPKHVSFFHRR